MRLVPTMRHVIGVSVAALLATNLLAVNSSPAHDGPSSNSGVVRLDMALDQLISPTLQPDPVASGFKFTERPMWREGQLWFTDEFGNISAVTPTGAVSTLIDYTHGPLAPSIGLRIGPTALATASDGSVIALLQNDRKIVRLIERNGKIHQKFFFDSYEDKHLNNPMIWCFCKMDLFISQIRLMLSKDATVIR